MASGMPGQACQSVNSLKLMPPVSQCRGYDITQWANRPRSPSPGSTLPSELAWGGNSIPVTSVTYTAVGEKGLSDISIRPLNKKIVAMPFSPGLCWIWQWPKKSSGAKQYFSLNILQHMVITAHKNWQYTEFELSICRPLAYLSNPMPLIWFVHSFEFFPQQL